jgi:ketosteroid isomerase-like protein
MPGDDEERDALLQERLDKEAIRDVLSRYCRGVDRRDADLVASCYHPDAYDDHMGREFSGRTVGQGLVDWMDDEMVTTTHNITTSNIAVFGDTAGSEAYTTSFHVRKDGEGGDYVLFSNARYVDRFERRDGEWRILERIVIGEFSGRLEMQRFPFDTPSRQDRTDPSYRILEP